MRMLGTALVAIGSALGIGVLVTRARAMDSEDDHDKPKPGPKPAPKPPGARTPLQAAQDLYAHVVNAIRDHNLAQLGARAAPSRVVRLAQTDMHITQDGIYGPLTKAAGERLTATSWPARPTQAQIVQQHQIPSHAISVKPAPVLHQLPAPPPPAHVPLHPSTSEAMRGTPVPAARQTPAPAARQTPAPAARQTPVARPVPVARQTPAPAALDMQGQPVVPARSKVEAANAFYSYITQMVRSGHGSQLGTKALPNEVVRQAQTDMGGLVADGIYGPSDRRRSKELTGREFPARTYTPPR